MSGVSRSLNASAKRYRVRRYDALVEKTGIPRLNHFTVKAGWLKSSRIAANNVHINLHESLRLGKDGTVCQRQISETDQEPYANV
jgi:hypothetical protein